MTYSPDKIAKIVTDTYGKELGGTATSVLVSNLRQLGEDTRAETVVAIVARKLSGMAIFPSSRQRREFENHIRKSVGRR